MSYNIVFINGKAFNCSDSMSLKDLLIYLDFNINLIAVEYNYRVLNSDSFHEIFLDQHDRIEIITIVGGG
uniref:Thiamine biosynthesis protein S n=1 Tax=Rhodymenia pseudopalmata TaxID=31502 RepID=A0A1C9C7R9_RHOPU|nr:thiamine biosynthesis protein S [Rhodymenia pseudopalmata]AOM64427.1 thiamine biosynthesis protein S [Rhodymenia pseudopalmata]